MDIIANAMVIDDELLGRQWGVRVTLSQDHMISRLCIIIGEKKVAKKRAKDIMSAVQPPEARLMVVGDRVVPNKYVRLR